MILCPSLLINPTLACGREMISIDSSCTPGEPLSLNVLTRSEIDIENIKIYLRIRPFVEREEINAPNRLGNPTSTLTIHPPINGGPATTVSVKGGTAYGGTIESFVYDSIGGLETGQEEVFETVARPVTDNCLLGYNGTIFA